MTYFVLHHNPGKKNQVRWSFFHLHPLRPLCLAHTMMDTSSPYFFLVWITVAPLAGLFIYLCLRLIVALCLPTPTSNDLPLNELCPETRVGCPDGLCYLDMFTERSHKLITRKLGHFPSILALSTISKLYRKKMARGKLELIGDGMAHYESDITGELVWEIVEKLTLPLDLIGGRNLVKVSSKPPQGYSYIQLFDPLYHNDILQFLCSNPTIQDLFSINTNYHLDLRGFLWNLGDNDCRIVICEMMTKSIWEEIGANLASYPEARITN